MSDPYETWLRERCRERQKDKEIERLKGFVRYLLVEWVYDSNLKDMGESGWPEDSIVEEAMAATGTPVQWGEEVSDE